MFSVFDYYSRGTISSESVEQILKAMQLRLAHDEVVEVIGQTGNINP